jgi:hypothetical protein
MHNEAKIRIRLGKALIEKNDFYFIKTKQQQIKNIKNNNLITNKSGENI